MKTYRQHVKSDGVKWFVTTIAILLIGVILAGIITEGFTDHNPYCWFGHEYGEDGLCIKCGAEKPAEDPDKGSSGMYIPEEIEGQGIKVTRRIVSISEYEEYGVSPLAENAVLLTATISPSNVPGARVDWFIVWENSESEFASNKNVDDFVTVEANGNLTAVISCLQPFGETIVVRAVSTEDPEIYATCSIEYVKRISGVTIDKVNDSTDFTLGQVNTYSYNVSYGIGTLEGELNIDSVVIVPSTDIQNRVTSGLGSAYGSQFLARTSITANIDSVISPFDFIEDVRSGGEPMEYNVYCKRAFNNVLDGADISHGDQQSYVTVSLNYTYNYLDEVVSSGTSTGKDFYISRGSLENYVVVQDVTLDQSVIVF